MQINKEEWSKFYSLIINELKKINIEECKDENGKVIGIKRPGGPGDQADRSDFKIQNKEFLEKANKLIPAKSNVWGIGIDWGKFRNKW